MSSMILIDIIIIICVSISGAVLLEYIPKALEARTLSKAIIKLNRSIFMKKVVPKARNKAQLKRRNALLSENGDSRATFLKLINEIESNIRTIAASISIDVNTHGILEIMKQLLRRKVVDSVLGEALKNIWYVRKRLIYGYELTEEELRFANDLAVILLSVLYSLKIEHDRLSGEIRE